MLIVDCCPGVCSHPGASCETPRPGLALSDRALQVLAVLNRGHSRLTLNTSAPVCLVNTEIEDVISLQIHFFSFLPEHWPDCGLLGFVEFLLTPLRSDVEHLEGGVADSTEPGNSGQQSEGPPGADPITEHL